MVILFSILHNVIIFILFAYLDTNSMCTIRDERWIHHIKLLIAMLHFFEQRSFKDKGEKISSHLFVSTTFVAIVCSVLYTFAWIAFIFYKC